jgi:hypothetical protein
MTVASIQNLDVHIGRQIMGKRTDKFLDKLERKGGANHIRLPRGTILDEGTTAQINDHPRQRFVHRKIRTTVPHQTHFIAQGLPHRLPQHNADILHRVVEVDVQISFGGHLQIDQPMLREERQHVVEKPYPSVDPRLTAPIEVDSQ